MLQRKPNKITMNIVDNTKSLIENLYLLSGPIIAILATVGIFQLRLTKKAMILSSRRNAAQLATKQIEIYNNTIVPLQNKYFQISKANNIPQVSIKIGEFNYEYLLEKLGSKKVREYITVRSKLNFPDKEVKYAMEAFSTYFINSVADEKIAFFSIGYSFCFWVEDHYFDIAWSLHKGEKYYFQNLISLYNLWSARIKKQDLSHKKEMIMKEINSISDTAIDPIGTK
jgi:hypothetical protein